MIIVTVPHSLCLSDTLGRNCDTLSLLASYNLVDKLTAKRLPVVYLPGNYHRSEVDLNRIYSRHTDYRQRLSSLLYSCSLLIDIHSFERNGFGSDVDLVILDNEPGTQYGIRLYNILKQKNVSVDYILGADYNDITQQGRQNGVPSILIEYGEFMKVTTVDHINNCILSWIYEMVGFTDSEIMNTQHKRFEIYY